MLFYTYVVDGQEYVDDMGRTGKLCPGSTVFWRASCPRPPVINVGTYLDFFEAQLEKGLSAAHRLHLRPVRLRPQRRRRPSSQEKYPDKKLVVIDSLCSSSGHGLLVDAAADLRDSGATLEETARWVLENRNKVHHQFFLQHDPVPPHRPCLRRSGHGGHHHEHLPHHAAG